LGLSYDVWSLRRLQAPKRYAVLLCFLRAALAEYSPTLLEKTPFRFAEQSALGRAVA